MLPNKPRGVTCMDDRRFSGKSGSCRSEVSWRDLPENCSAILPSSLLVLKPDASYEVEHHRNAALAAGIRREQLERLRESRRQIALRSKSGRSSFMRKKQPGTPGCRMPSGRSSVFSGIDNVSSCS